MRLLFGDSTFAENLYHAGHHGDRWGGTKHLCGAGGHHHQREEPASTVGEGELQCRHPWKRRQGHTDSGTWNSKVFCKCAVDLWHFWVPVIIEPAECLPPWISAEAECYSVLIVFKIHLWKPVSATRDLKTCLSLMLLEKADIGFPVQGKFHGSRLI